MFWRKVDQEEWLSKIDINVDEYVMITISRNGYHIICGAHMNILFVITLIILVLTKWSYSSPPPHPMVLTIEPRMATVIEKIVQLLWNTCLSGIHSWSHAWPHNTQNIGVLGKTNDRIRHPSLPHPYVTSDLKNPQIHQQRLTMDLESVTCWTHWFFRMDKTRTHVNKCGSKCTTHLDSPSFQTSI